MSETGQIVTIIQHFTDLIRQQQQADQELNKVMRMLERHMANMITDDEFRLEMEKIKDDIKSIDYNVRNLAEKFEELRHKISQKKETPNQSSHGDLAIEVEKIKAHIETKKSKLAFYGTIVGGIVSVIIAFISLLPGKEEKKDGDKIKEKEKIEIIEE